MLDPRRFMVSVSLLTALFATPAHAVDGIIEINQAKAIAGGVTLTDTPQFPVTLDSSGSYRLTSNLDLTYLDPEIAKNTTAIVVSGSNTVATIDLNGFAIIGPTFCGLSCTPTGGSGQAITSGSSDQYIILRNGFIRGMGSVGTGFFNALIENVTSEHNGGAAFFIQGGVVRNSVANRNASGIDAPGSFVTGTSSRNNLGTGIKALRIDNSVATGNGSYGFQVTGSVSNSLSGDNADVQLQCETVCPITGNYFGGCSGSGCFGGGGTVYQVPDASNSCGGPVCPANP